MVRPINNLPFFCPLILPSSQRGEGIEVNLFTGRPLAIKRDPTAAMGNGGVRTRSSHLLETIYS